MNKRFTICMLSAALVCGALSSCTVEPYYGNSSNYYENYAANNNNINNSGNNNNSPAPAQTKPKQKAAEAPKKAEAPASEYTYTAKLLMERLNSIDLVDGGTSVSVDSSDVIDENGFSYSSVTDSRFATLNDVTAYVKGSVCGDLLNRYCNLYTGSSPMFKEANGALYYLDGARGCGFNYTGEPVVTSSTNSSFTFSVPIDNYGIASDLIISAVNDGGVWKASSMTFN